MTALIDVIFQLLLFFVVTTSFRGFDAIDVDLPHADAAGITTADAPLTITVDAGGQIFLEEAKLTPDALDVRLAEEARVRVPSETVIVVRGDRESRHHAIVSVLDAAAKHGFSRISVTTRGSRPPR